MKKLDKTDLTIGLVTGVGLLATVSIITTCLGFAGCFKPETIETSSRDYDGINQIVTSPVDNLHTFNLKYKVSADKKTYTFQGTKGVNEYTAVSGNEKSLSVSVNSDRRTTDYINFLELESVNTEDKVYTSTYGCETPIDLQDKIIDSVRVSGNETYHAYMNSWKDEETNQTYNYLYIQFDRSVKAKDINVEFTTTSGVARFDLNKVTISLTHDQDLSDTSAGPQILDDDDEEDGFYGPKE